MDYPNSRVEYSLFYPNTNSFSIPPQFLSTAFANSLSASSIGLNAGDFYAAVNEAGQISAYYVNMPQASVRLLNIVPAQTFFSIREVKVERVK